MTSTCENCDKATRNDAHLCDDCTDKAARWIGEIVWIDDELDTTIGKVKAAGDAGPASAETALPINIHASEKRTALRHALVIAVRFCSEEGVRASGPAALPEDNLIAMSRWLLWRVDGLALNDMGPQVLADVVNAVRACKRVIDKPPERSYAGPCPECKRDLYHRPDAVQVSCSGCGQRWDVAEVGRWMRSRLDEYFADRLVTAGEARTYLGRIGIGVEQRIIDRWVAAGRLAAHGRHGAKSLYNWSEILPLATAHVAQTRVVS